MDEVQNTSSEEQQPVTPAPEPTPEAVTPVEPATETQEPAEQAPESVEPEEVKVTAADFKISPELAAVLKPKLIEKLQLDAAMTFMNSQLVLKAVATAEEEGERLAAQVSETEARLSEMKAAPMEHQYKRQHRELLQFTEKQLADLKMQLEAIPRKIEGIKTQSQTYLENAVKMLSDVQKVEEFQF